MPQDYRMTLPTVSPRCHRGRAWTFKWSSGLCGRATQACQVRCEIPDWEGRGCLRRARMVKVYFRDASAHQTWLCKRTRWRRNFGRGPHLFKKLSCSLHWERQLSVRAAGTIQTTSTKGNGRSGWAFYSVIVWPNTELVEEIRKAVTRCKILVYSRLETSVRFVEKRWRWVLRKLINEKRF